MKHIKKKCLNAVHLSDKVVDVFNSVEVDHEAVNKIVKTNFEGRYGLILTSTNELIQTFKYRTKKSTIFIPEPNPILIYFNIAQTYLRQLKPAKADLLLSLDKPNADISQAINNTYSYFSLSSICATFLFNSLEAFINLLLPEEFQYVVETTKNTEMYNKEQIQRRVSFNDKIKLVVPLATKKAFHSEYGAKFERIVKLNLLRDEIVHTKTDLSNKPNWYEKLYTLLLDFDFEKTILDVRDYINYYSPSLIEECDCGKDF